jgi:cytochrome P450
MLLKSFVAITGGALAMCAAWITYRKVKMRLSAIGKIPSPPEPSLIFGHFFQVLRTAVVGRTHLQWALDHGPILRFNMFSLGDRVMITDPDALKRVLVTNVANYPKPDTLRKSLATLLGDGLLTAEGESHKRQRRILSHAFHFDTLTNIADTFVAQTCKLVDIWLEKVKQSPDGSIEVDMKRAMNSLTVDIIGLAGFGFDFKACRQVILCCRV